MHQRIEKSAFNAGEYVGYCDGVWHIKKRDDLKLWEARKAIFRAIVAALRFTSGPRARK